MASPDSAQLTPDQERRKRARLHAGSVNRGLKWFWIIVGITVLNTILVRGEEHFTIIGGLGFTQLVDELLKTDAEHAGAQRGLVIQLIGSALYAFAIGAFVLAALLGARGHRWAMLAGIVLYALDLLILVGLQDWKNVFAHAFVLYMLWQGWVALNKLLAVRALDPVAEPPMPSDPR